MRAPRYKFKNDYELSTYKLIKSRSRGRKFEVAYESESLPYIIRKVYIPDFVITFPSGHKTYIEYKGYLRRDDEKKLLGVKEQNPDIDLRIVFERDNKLAGRKIRYSTWCIKHGIPYAIGTVPLEWMEEPSEMDKKLRSSNG